MRYFVFLSMLFIHLTALPTKSFSLWNSPGSDGARILKQSTSARALAAGEAFVAVSNDINALYYNPAGMGYITTTELSGSYIKSFEDTYYGYIGYVQPFSSGALAGSYLSYDGGLIEINEEDGSSATLKAQQDMVFSLGAGWRFDSFPQGVSLGTTVKVISSLLIEEYSALALAADFGIFYPTPITDLSVAFSIQNIGTKLNYFSEKDTLPLTIRLGASYRLPLNQNNRMRISFDLVNNKLNSGMEYSLYNILHARIGYKFDRDLVGVSYGLGLCIGPFKTDYAFIPLSSLGNSHLFTISIGNTDY